MSNKKSDYIKQNTVSTEFKTGESWAILSPIEQSIKAKIEAVGTPLKDWYIKISRGVLTGLNEAFIIDKPTRDRLIAKDPKSAEIIRPILRGKDIKRNKFSFADKYLICLFPSKSYDIDDFPAVRDYLLTFDKRVLAQTGEKNIDGVKGKNARKKTNNAWFETQDSISYWDDFNKRKIVWADIAKEPTFVTIDEPIFFNNTCYMIVGAPSGLTDILNSKMIEWYFPKIATDIGNGGVRYFKQFVELIRVPKTIGDRKYSDEDIFNMYGLNDEEISYIRSIV